MLELLVLKRCLQLTNMRTFKMVYIPCFIYKIYYDTCKIYVYLFVCLCSVIFGVCIRQEVKKRHVQKSPPGILDAKRL